MPLNSDMVGASTDWFTHEVDARWTMAHAASLGDALPRHFDTRLRPDVLAHPMFPVCFEWPTFLALATLPELADLEASERARGVHATHDLVLHRPVRAGHTVATRATVIGVERRTPGAYQVVRLDSRTGDGEPLCTTYYGSLYRGVEVKGPDRPAEDAPAAPAPLADGAAIHTEVTVPIDAGAAHTYTECARIWNPIHTDAAVAERAGLPGIILHGTATLSLGVSRVIEHVLAGQAERVRRIRGRFAAMVLMPSSIRVRIFAPTADGVAHFDVWNEAGAVAVRDGTIELF